MILVVLGAGASFDLDPTHPPTPNQYETEPRMPLAKDLFADRAAFNECLEEYPAARTLIPYLRGQTDVEAQLQRLQAEADSDAQRVRQLAAIRYYLRDMIAVYQSACLQRASHITNHATLIDQLRRTTSDEIYLVTFNYDTLLENALTAQLDLKFDSFEGYIADSRFMVFKLHGSCNWARIVKTPLLQSGNVAAELIRRAPELEVSDEFCFATKFPRGHFMREFPEIRPGGSVVHHKREVGLFPAIAIPVRDKDQFECPSAHTTRLRDVLPKVQGILTVGWRASESQFLKMLSEHLRQPVIRCVVVSGNYDGAQETITNLRSANTNIGFTSFHGGFTRFVQESQLGRCF
jgi:hypothetical protein